MRHRLALLALTALTACATGSAIVTPIAQLAPAPEITADSLLAINALCSADATRPAGYAPDLKLAGGMGTGGFTVDTTVPAAQAWFNYGLALSHAFYHQDAKLAMKRAVELDPACARCAWGEAWVLGPTLNYGLDDDERKAALAAAERAKSLVKADDKLAVQLIDAIVTRYQPVAARTDGAGKPAKSGEGEQADPSAKTDAAYAAAMAKIAADWPAETEVQVLATHAMLIPVRADDNTQLKPALAILESVLKTHPDDTGAIHYYIHATEFDDRAEDAIAYANRLGDLAPAASHLVHMPAHTFFRAGRYMDAARVNAKAIAADTGWMSAGGDPRAPMVKDAPLPMYYAHNLGFGLAGALMAGDASLSVQYAEHAAKAFPDNGQELGPDPLPRSYVALALYAPDEMLAVPVSSRTGIKYKIYRAYGRAEVFLRRGDAASARREIAALRDLKTDVAEKAIALGVLEGRLAMAGNNPREAVRRFSDATEAQKVDEDYMDPPTWWYPVRRSIAAAWLKSGDYAKAESEAIASLKLWKHDALALWVLGQAQIAQARATEGQKTLAEARKLWRGDFDSITVEAI